MIDRDKVKRILEINKKRRSKRIKPSPRYDDIFFNGLRWLNRQAENI